ncbi:hypothetical protein ASG87_15510 [Frateuria sp. Soil773]|nr:hypothetical protein ASG87_15510 [Frateuria sp. Soil773]
MRIGDPVIFSTGNEVSPETDFTSAGEMGLSLTRTYNYYWNGIGIFGRRWLSDYDFKLLFTTNDPASACYPRPGNSICDPAFKPIWAQRPDGRMIKFNYASSPTPGWYEDKASPVAKILKSGSTYVLYSEDHTVEVYDAAGFPSSLKNPQGIGWTFQYDANHYLTRVTHTSGRHVDFTWTDGRLTQVTDPAGHAYTYSYKTLSVSTSNAVSPGASPSATMVNAGDIGVHPMLLPPHDPRHDDPPPLPPTLPINSMVALLTGTVQPSAIPTRITYHYEDTRFPTALTGRTINDVRQSWIAYDANGRAAETKLAGGIERYQFSYALYPDGNIQSTTVINPLNKSTTYKFDPNGNDIGVEEARSTNCPLAVKAAEYGTDGYLAASTDFMGRVTTFDFNAKGQLLERVENANATGASQRLVIRYSWDADSRKTKETVGDDHEFSYEYGAGGRLASLTVKNLSSKVAASQGQSRTTAYTYATWPNGLLSSMTVDGPLAGTGDTIVLNYSQAGDLLTVKNSLGQTTTYEGYNDLGQPGFVTGPNGEKAGFLYDARGRVIETQTYRNGATQHTTYEYDGFGRLAKATRPDGQYHGYQYDAAGRLVSEYEPETGGTFAQTVYTYNALSQPTLITTQRVFREPQRGTVP